MGAYIKELADIRHKLLDAIEGGDMLYAKMQVNNIDSLLYQMTKHQILQSEQKIHNFHLDDMEMAYNAGNRRGQYEATGQDCEKNCPLFIDWINQNYK